MEILGKKEADLQEPSQQREGLSTNEQRWVLQTDWYTRYVRINKWCIPVANTNRQTDS